jgi:hypothetical protein
VPKTSIIYHMHFFIRIHSPRIFLVWDISPYFKLITFKHTVELSYWKIFVLLYLIFQAIQPFMENCLLKLAFFYWNLPKWALDCSLNQNIEIRFQQFSTRGIDPGCLQFDLKIEDQSILKITQHCISVSFKVLTVLGNKLEEEKYVNSFVPFRCSH